MCLRSRRGEGDMATSSGQSPERIDPWRLDLRLKIDGVESLLLKCPEDDIGTLSGQSSDCIEPWRLDLRLIIGGAESESIFSREIGLMWPRVTQVKTGSDISITNLALAPMKSQR
ncbi:uncharacterized protein N7500_009177 [Penicillium coprophilum]|uniref:uncharacterized protein n=1 Tax=Penicillium coprophilum TaxID=36646 RepID=UPI0023952B9F|nr:uncharacterized protein N7500_009177 [Penicillium coprophilum]KAJ5153738.1 hypothetical protein N7500_009177 [Penicillium coprophilum]